MTSRQQLHQRFTSSSDSKVPYQDQFSIQLLLGKFWRWFVDFLYKEPEPEVWERRDAYGGLRLRQGNTWWFAYDPATGKSASLGSEQEVLIWIEQLYYQKTLAANKHRW
ncbi:MULTISPECIES: hypothetical protein [Nostoc]|uniref:Uncharacterized protein n=1 Tax=Nostoc paludosum FACHB-159 TaxID=2692908 RepID=A0ABR8KHD5_9NOSO|nr:MULTISPECIES: hypothetical protein [Nostoc]MBD2681898.1 hypothetical protein [Nostoc sp. FACHB-857]MBD2738273.1 hypothetical protein [Nostoc paludosum FACHB-159]